MENSQLKYLLLSIHIILFQTVLSGGTFLPQVRRNYIKLSTKLCTF